MKKKFISLSLVLMMLISLMPNYTNAEQDIKIIVDGKEVKTDVAPYIENGRTMVPLRFIADYFACNTSWSEALKTISINKNNTPTTKVFEDKYWNEEMSLEPEKMLMNGDMSTEKFSKALY